MMRSLFAAVSGLKNHQTKMDVIGNNIANVNTIGFKGSTVNFQDVMSQTLQSAASAAGNRGGTNPMQVGLGMGLASININFTDGSPEATGRQTDLAISGSGFFIVSDGVSQLYTRAGNFDFEPAGNFIDSGTGYTVYGWQANANGSINTSAPTGPINISTMQSMPGLSTTSMKFGDNLSADAPIGTAVQNSIIVYDSLGIGHKVNTTFTKVGEGKWVYNNVVPDAVSGSLKNSVGELTFNSSGAVSGQSTVNTASITPNTVTVTNTKLNTTAGSVDTQYFTVFDSNNNAHELKMKITYNGVISGSNNWNYTLEESGLTGGTVATGSITDSTLNAPYVGLPTSFNFSSGTASITWGGQVAATAAATTATTNPYATTTLASMQFTPAGGADPLTISEDMAGITQYGSDGQSTLQILFQNGYAQGELQKYSINTDGVVLGTYSNGETRSLAQVALATFSNPGGLARGGSSFFVKSPNSGEPQIGTTGTGGRGRLNPGNLEMSNVDLAKEFSNMIVTQRGFQANSKIISTTDEMLQELANLKR